MCESGGRAGDPREDEGAPTKPETPTESTGAP